MGVGKQGGHRASEQRPTSRCAALRRIFCLFGTWARVQLNMVMALTSAESQVEDIEADALILPFEPGTERFKRWDTNFAGW